jgi:catechol 2,3-dioxygenase-like lactoylglutathione lyase family enzyme
MFDEIETVCLFVDDQDRANAFNTEILGFEHRTDQPLYPGAQTRWLAVAPKGAITELTLNFTYKNWEHH